MKAEYPDDDYLALASITELLRAEDRSSEESAKLFDYEEERNRAKVNRLKAENEMREKFFNWASKLTVGIIVGNFVIFAGYIVLQACGLPSIPERVMLAWIVATIVEIVGIVAIIARHLFPGRKNQNGKSPKSKSHSGE